MKRIFEDILDDIDIEDKSDSSVIGKLDPSEGPVDVSRYDFVMHFGFHLGTIFNKNDIKDTLVNSRIIQTTEFCDFFKKVEEYLDVYTDEYWTDGLWYTNNGILLDDLTEYILDNDSSMKYVYGNRVYYINFDNNYHHFFKFLQLYSNYFYYLLRSTTNKYLTCVPYEKIKEFKDINSITRAMNVQSSLSYYNSFFMNSFTFNPTLSRFQEKIKMSREEKAKTSRNINVLRPIVENDLTNDAHNIYHYFYLDYKILKVLDKFETEKERLDFIKDRIWELRIKDFRI